MVQPSSKRLLTEDRWSNARTVDVGTAAADATTKANAAQAAAQAAASADATTKANAAQTAAQTAASTDAQTRADAAQAAAILDANGRYATLTGLYSASPPKRYARPKFALVPRSAAWTVSGAGVTVDTAYAADPSPIGTTSVRVSSPGTTGVTKLLRNILGTAVDFTGKCFGFWLKIPDMTHINAATGITIYLGDSAWANYFAFTVLLNPAKAVHENQWAFVTVPWVTVGTTGTPSRAAIQQIRFDLKDDAAGVPLEFRFGDQWASVPETTVFPNGAVSLTFDDTYGLDLVYPKLVANAIPATLFPIGDTVGNSGRISVAQMRNWVDTLGWEVANHAALLADHVSIGTLSQADRIANLARVKKWNNDNGFNSPIYAYPNGASTEATFTDVRPFFAVGRGTGGELETLPPQRVEYIRAYSSGPSATMGATLKAMADKAVASKSWLVVVFHSFVTSGGGSLDTLQSEFNTFADYLATLSIEKLTMSDVLNRLG